MESHLPLAPDGAAPAFGVVVEESIDCLYLKVQTLLPASRLRSRCVHDLICATLMLPRSIAKIEMAFFLILHQRLLIFTSRCGPCTSFAMC